MKHLAKAMIPRRYRVPIKLCYTRWRYGLERELAILDSLIAAGDLCLDIGANYGIYLYTLHTLGGRVVAFEPQPECAGVLAAWARGKRGVSVEECALSDFTGRSKLKIPVDFKGIKHPSAASMEERSAQNAETIDVAVRTLDSFNFSNVRFMKIDVEGHERAVIQGAVTTIRKSSPVMLVEIEQRHNDRLVEDVFSEIAGHGYRGFFCHENRLRSLEEFSLEQHQNLLKSRESNAAYINNFFFFPIAGLHNGEFQHVITTLDKRSAD